jgi:hypothetical protein
MRHINLIIRLGTALVLALCLGGSHALGAELYIYPNKGQSSEQQSRDRYDCHRWAVQQTGVDPTSIGAGTGGLIGGMRQRQQAQSQQQAQANQAAQQQSASAGYDRALSACLSGRGYTVK